ncbi:hypothetical protein BH11ARM2_BH11ARM2_06960 [soil metagenome]
MIELKYTGVWPRVLGFLALSLAVVPLASAQRRPEVRVYVNNSLVRFDRVAPVRIGRHILVPMRGVFEKMGATVTYDARRRRVLAHRGKMSVVLPLSGRTAYVNGEPRLMDARPRISKGHVVVPIRFLGETLDAGVIYSAPFHTVRVISH